MIASAFKNTSLISTPKHPTFPLTAAPAVLGNPPAHSKPLNFLLNEYKMRSSKLSDANAEITPSPLLEIVEESGFENHSTTPLNC